MNPEFEAIRAFIGAALRQGVPGYRADWVIESFHRIEDENKALRKALDEYASHQSWRCDYRNRYGECMCGLDETMAKFGLDPVPPNDPEAE